MGLDMSLDLRPNLPLELVEEIVDHNRWVFRKKYAEKALNEKDILSFGRLVHSTEFFSSFIEEDEELTEESIKESMQPTILEAFLEGEQGSPEAKEEAPKLTEFLQKHAFADEPHLSEKSKELLKKHPSYAKAYYLDTVGENDKTYDHSFMKLHSMYWRKDNHIHNWFVEHVQDGEDDCGSYTVTKTHLLGLKDTLQEAIDIYKQQQQAHGSILYEEELEDVLPTVSGFFFGGTDYNDSYHEANVQTFEYLSKVLDEVDFDKYMFVYHSSW